MSRVAASGRAAAEKGRAGPQPGELLSCSGGSQPHISPLPGFWCTLSWSSPTIPACREVPALDGGGNLKKRRARPPHTVGVHCEMLVSGSRAWSVPHPGEQSSSHSRFPILPPTQRAQLQPGNGTHLADLTLPEKRSKRTQGSRNILGFGQGLK